MGAHLCYAYTWYKLEPCAWACWIEGSECRALYEPVECGIVQDLDSEQEGGGKN